MSESIIRAGIIGCGGISQVHRQALSEIPGVQIVAVTDIVAERAQRAAQETGARVEASAQELIACPDVDVVHLCVPHSLHAPFALMALAAGKHVLTEKPMATSLQDARAMIAASERPGAPLLGVCFQNRYNASVAEAKRLIGAGELGTFLGARASVWWHRTEAYYRDSGWRGTWAMEGGGVLINQAIHTLDLMSYLAGPIARVSGRVSTDVLGGVIEVEDNAHAVLCYESGARGVIHCTTSYVTDAPIELELAFERGALKLVGDALYQLEGEQWRLVLKGQPPMLKGKAYWGASHQALIEDFYRAAREGTHFWLDGRQGYPALNLVLSIFESSRQAGWVALKPLGQEVK